MNTKDVQELVDRVLADTPVWVLVVTAGVVLVAALVLGFLTTSRLTARRTEREQYRREALALAREQGQPAPAEPLRMDPKPLLGGIAVSLYGLWGFATGTLHLPVFFAVGFVSMFDVLELRLFSLMYKSADPSKGWTPQLRLLQTTAWGFVAASAIANIAHAPNAIAAPFMALMPIGAAWVIELDLRRALAGKEAEERPQQQGVKPGPFRLAGLLWRRLWAWGFRVAGLDVTDRADEMVRRARARDAADASYELRKALKDKEQLEEVVGNAGVPGRRRGKVSEEQKRLDALNKALEKKIRPKAQAALEMADTQDPEQGLQLMQRMAWLTRADDVALLDYGPDSPAMQVLEELNIAANADFITSAKRARDADALAEAAEEKRRKAEEAVAAAQEKLKALEAEREKTAAEAAAAAEEIASEIKAEDSKLQALRQERQSLESSGASASQLYEKTAKALEEVQQEAREARDRVQELEGRLKSVSDDRDRRVTEAEQARKTAQESWEKVLGLQEQVAELERLQATGSLAKTVARPRVDARINRGKKDGASLGGSTREQVTALYRSLPAEKQQLRGRPLARAIAAAAEAQNLALDPDTVRRSHISEELLEDYLQQEEDAAQESGGAVPAPREQSEPQHETVAQ
ncbi:hypothetical protein [Streptomyces sp. NPDC053560]|uniref:hypothetical protein n=1 Tax=Streptomyces sp. NPDC053560 TaxID=3365711 RepID=UPI0037D97224